MAAAFGRHLHLAVALHIDSFANPFAGLEKHAKNYMLEKGCTPSAYALKAFAVVPIYLGQCAFALTYIYHNCSDVEGVEARSAEEELENPYLRRKAMYCDRNSEGNCTCLVYNPPRSWTQKLTLALSPQ